MSNRFFLGALVALVLATPSLGSEAGKFSSIHSVAIVVNLGNKFSFERSGLTVFDNDLQYTNMADWGVDDYVSQALTRFLSGQFEIRKISLDVDPLGGCNDASACAQLLPKTDAVDAYVLVYRSVSAGFGGPGKEFHGVGLFHMPGIFGPAKAVLHVIYGLAVIDAKTGTVIDWTAGQMSKSYFGDHPPPVTDMSGSVWPETVPNLMPAQAVDIKTAIFASLDDSLPSTVEDIGLLR